MSRSIVSINKFDITSTILSDRPADQERHAGIYQDDRVASGQACRAAGRRDDRGRSVAGSRLQHDLWRQRRGASRRMLRTLFQSDRHCGRSGERRRDRDRVQGHQYARRQPALRAARDGHFVQWRGSARQPQYGLLRGPSGCDDQRGGQHRVDELPGQLVGRAPNRSSAA